MRIEDHWPMISRICRKSVGLFVFGTADPDGTPRLTPIGSLIPRDDCTAFYFERYPSMLPANLERDDRITVLAADMRKSFWVLSFFLGHYTHPPAVRLYGRAGGLRPATPEELATFRNHPLITLVRIFCRRGYRVGWEPLTQVRDIRFDSFEPCDMGAMSRGHWDGGKS
jgi:uncharacterized protein